MEQTRKEQLIDLSFYKPNATSYKLVLLAAVLELVYLVLMLTVMQLEMIIGIFILVNICFLLLIFTTALEIKVYTPRSSYIAIGFGVYSIARFILIPLMIEATIPMSTLIPLYIICGVSAFAMIIGGLISMKKVIEKKQYRKDGKINAIQISK